MRLLLAVDLHELVEAGNSDWIDSCTFRRLHWAEQVALQRMVEALQDAVALQRADPGPVKLDLLHVQQTL